MASRKKRATAEELLARGGLTGRERAGLLEVARTERRRVRRKASMGPYYEAVKRRLERGDTVVVSSWRGHPARYSLHDSGHVVRSYGPYSLTKPMSLTLAEAASTIAYERYDTRAHVAFEKSVHRSRDARPRRASKPASRRFVVHYLGIDGKTWHKYTVTAPSLEDARSTAYLTHGHGRSRAEAARDMSSRASRRLRKARTSRTYR